MREHEGMELGAFLRQNGSVLLVLVLGLLLLLLPDGKKDEGSSDFDKEEAKLSAVIGRIEGAGETCVLFRSAGKEQRGGVVVVCEGAESAEVRLNVTKAVSAYTGLGSDRIIILKLK